ncbi:MAG TPA: histidinol-phosphate transaminase [bacterium]|nr:histidinol-phosphate transaminase [bacterium]
MIVRPRPEVERLRVYRLRRDAAVRLNQNESPLDWPDEAKAEVLARVAARDWNRYPADPEPVRAAFAAHVGVEPGMVLATNGSNEALLALVETFALGREVVLTAPGYSMATPLAIVGGAAVRAVRLREDFSLDVPAMLEAGRSAALILLASPNNPTGNAFAPADLEAIAAGARGVVVVDEAYAPFAEDTCLPALQRWSNLVVVRTMSKGWALAGGRIGWIVASEPLAAEIAKALPPYNLNVFAQEAALAALARPEWMRAQVRAILAQRAELARALAAVPGVEVFPSQANFLLFRTPLPAADLFERLLARGVLVRDVSAQPMLARCLRVTVGTAEENARFLEALRASLGQGAAR